MLMVGLTGGIGAGKSAVAARLAELGALVVDSDLLAREVVAPGTEGLAEVVAAFGDGVLTPAGALDRPALAALVFEDEAARARLEGIIHPRVRARMASIVSAAPPDAIVVNDVPLLVEAGLSAHYDLVVVVLASESVRLARLTDSRRMSEDEARARMAAQASDDQRRAVADVVIENNGTLDELRAAVDEVWRERLIVREDTSS
jgi:dephospho-CoA kinase